MSMENTGASARPTAPLKVLIIDDSQASRQSIKNILAAYPDIVVIGEADNGESGLKEALALKPAVITLDLEMPKMDGFTFLRLLMAKQPTPVIVISTESRKQAVFQVLELGAFDFVVKPTNTSLVNAQENFKEQIIAKIAAVRSLQLAPFVKQQLNKSHLLNNSAQKLLHKVLKESTSTKEAQTTEIKGEAKTAGVKSDNAKAAFKRIVCIGASTGGPAALQFMFKSLQVNEQTIYLIAQHMPAKFTTAFAERLAKQTGLTVVEAEDGLKLAGGTVYLAPGGAHLQVRAESSGGLSAEVLPVAKGDNYVPAIDRLFSTVAKQCATHLAVKPGILAVVLTGMGTDACLGVQAIHQHGGKILVESAETAIVYGMPEEVIKTGVVDEILPLPNLIQKINDFVV